jgi:HK97 family phage major capsid protein
MADETTAVAADTTETKPTPRVEITREAPRVDVELFETDRQTTIRNMTQAENIPPDLIAHWIKSGTPVKEVSADILRIKEKRNTDASKSALVGMERKEINRYSLLRALRASQSKDWTKAGLELEAHRYIMDRDARNPRTGESFFVPLDVQMRGHQAQRDMTAAGSSGSAFLVSQDNLAGSFVELLRNQSVVMSLGATRLSGLVGNVTIPRQTGASTAYWLANENTQITESQPSLGQITLQPKNVAALTEISHQLMFQADPSAEQLVINDLSRVLALAADVAALRGSGTNGQPQGIVGTTGVGSFTTDGTNTYADVVGAQEDVFAANALGPGCAYVADATSAALLMGRSRFASTDTPIWDGSLYQATMAGFPARASNQMGSSTMLFGLWPSLIIAEWGVLEVMLNPYSDFTRGLSAIRAWYTMDVALRYPAAFTYDATVA